MPKKTYIHKSKHILYIYNRTQMPPIYLEAFGFILFKIVISQRRHKIVTSMHVIRSEFTICEHFVISQRYRSLVVAARSQFCDLAATTSFPGIANLCSRSDHKGKGSYVSFCKILCNFCSSRSHVDGQPVMVGPLDSPIPAVAMLVQPDHPSTITGL